MTDHSDTGVLYKNSINEASIPAATGLTNSAIFIYEYIMQLNGSFAVIMLQTKLLDKYIEYDSDVDIFMSSLLFPLACGFSDTSEVVDFKAYSYGYMFLNHYYVSILSSMAIMISML